MDRTMHISVHGQAGVGKSTFLNLLQRILKGQYSFSECKNEDHGEHCIKVTKLEGY